MIGHITNGIRSACTRTWIDTAIIDARLVRAAFGVHCTFRTTTNIRIAKVIVDARTDGIITDSIGAAWRWIAWIVCWSWFGMFNDFDALGEWIAGEMWTARTNWDVILDTAFGVEAAGAFAWIATAFSDTRFVRITVRVDNTFGSAIWRCSIVVW